MYKRVFFCASPTFQNSEVNTLLKIKTLFAQVALGDYIIVHEKHALHIKVKQVCIATL